MPTVRLIAPVIIAVVLLATSAGALAGAGPQPPAAPGLPPTFKFDRCAKPPCTKPVIVASGTLLEHPTEIVAHSEVSGRTFFEGDTFYRSGPFAPFASGPEQNVPERGRALSFLSWYGFDRIGHVTHVVGLTRADVASVRVRYRTHGDWRNAGSLFNVVEGDLLAKTGGEEPFGVFAASARRCIDARRFRSVAFDAEGRQLGSTRFPHPDFVYVCHRKDAAPLPRTTE